LTSFLPSFSTFVTIRRNPNDAPLSPTHYPQTATPEHAPPSAEEAQRYIHERIRPLSQVSEGHYLPMDRFKFKDQKGQSLVNERL